MNAEHTHQEIQALLEQAKELLTKEHQAALAEIIDNIEHKLGPHFEKHKKISYLESLINASRILNSTLDLEELLSRFMELATKEMKADRSTLYLIDDNKKELWSLIAQGTDMIEIRLPIGRGIAGKVAATGEVINISDAYHDPRFYKEIDRKIGYTTRNILCMPVKNNIGTIIGVIQILNKLEGNFTEDDEYFLENLSLQTAVAIENAKLHKEALERRRLEAELRVAFQIQQNLLPSGAPELDNIQLCGANIPCLEVGGDYFDFIKLERATAIAIGDVSGKGIPAALIMANLQAALRVLAPTSRSTANIVDKINTLLKETSLANRFVTFFYCIYDCDDSMLTFTNAGHNPPIMIGEQGPARFLTTEGLIMGAFSDACYVEDTVRLNEGDVIVFYTDGITEAVNIGKEHFGEERLVEMVFQHRHLSAGQIKTKILDTLAEFSGDIPSNDDITLVVLKIPKP